METLSEDFMKSDIDSQMTMLTHTDFTEEHLGVSDEVEDLQNSLRQAVHDDSVRPKMQCLMMDPSFSMVAMQGEDSGIEWETSPSRCSTPWLSEGGNPTFDCSSPAAVRPATHGSLPAGRIIFVMDEAQISRRKKTEDLHRGQKTREYQQLVFEDSDETSERPELVGVSLPNVKFKEEGNEEQVIDPVMDKEQRLFCLVSEGSEILNIMVPPKLSTVDEEESRVMLDNLSYLEESHVSKINEETNNYVFESNYVVMNSTQTPAGSEMTESERARVVQSVGPDMMDPPGAPMVGLADRGATGNVDYFEKFTLIDAQAPGSPAVITMRKDEAQSAAAKEIQSNENPDLAKDKHLLLKVRDATTEEEFSSELLDEMFYGGTDDKFIKHVDTEHHKVANSLPAKISLKESGSALFSSQEDILTPIYLPEGPPKIIDPILLEEPKAMAFLYTDLYEEAMGGRKKDEDAESATSEKSFHSRHSDREARGYLEKYVLKDETPVLEQEPDDAKDSEEGDVWMLSQEPCDMAAFLPVAGEGEVADAEEEITDFFRLSTNSSPCDREAVSQSIGGENDGQSKVKQKAKVAKTTHNVPETSWTVENPTDPSGVARKDLFSEDPGQRSITEHSLSLDMKYDILSTIQPVRPALDMPKPVPPPRRKAASALKAILNITPLTSVEPTKERDQQREEREKASSAETADGRDGEETKQAPSQVSGAQDTEIVQGKDTFTETMSKVAMPDKTGGNETMGEEKSEAKTVKRQREIKLTDIKPAELAQKEVDQEGGVDTMVGLTKKGES